MERERARHDRQEPTDRRGAVRRGGGLHMAGNRAIGRLLQRRLVVGPALDPAEAEADAVASEVVDALARRSAAGNAEGGVVEPNLAQAVEAGRSGGRPLHPALADDFGFAFGGVDFSGVRIHDDAQAHALSRTFSAEAFTTGRDVFFSAGAFRPDTDAGRLMLAHELAHVVQQGHGPTDGGQA